MMETMQAVQVQAPGGPEQLTMGTVERPMPGPTEVLVRVRATALNRADTYQRRGHYDPPPGASPILGLEMAGEVVAVGSDVSRWRAGAAVFGLLAGGGYAEFVAVDEGLLLPKPEGLSFTEAAAIPEVFLTAYQALFWLGELAAGDHALIHAGGSGVGTAAIQLTRAAGATPHITASAGKHAACRTLGAATTIDYAQEDVAGRMLEATDGHGADVILDFIGAGYARKNIRALAQDGRWVVLALMGGATVEAFPLGQLFRKRGSLRTSTLRNRTLAYKRQLVAAFANDYLPLLQNKNLQPVIDSIHPWANVQEAHRHMENNRNTGKIVLRVEA